MVELGYTAGGWIGLMSCCINHLCYERLREFININGKSCTAAVYYSSSKSSSDCAARLKSRQFSRPRSRRKMSMKSPRILPELGYTSKEGIPGRETFGTMPQMP